MAEMHDVVEMLLNRMKDYPEDFVGNPDDYRDMTENKWKKALRLISGVVAPHEKEALDIRFEEARRAVYMGAALKTMLSADDPEDEKGKTDPNIFKYQSLSQNITGPVGSPDAISYIQQLELRLKETEYRQQNQLLRSQYAAQMTQQLAEKQYATNNA